MVIHVLGFHLLAVPSMLLRETKFWSQQTLRQLKMVRCVYAFACMRVVHCICKCLFRTVAHNCGNKKKEESIV